LIKIRKFYKFVCFSSIIIFYIFFDNSIVFAEENENISSKKLNDSYFKLIIFIFFSGFFLIIYFYFLFKIQSLSGSNMLNENSSILGDGTKNLIILNDSWQRLISIISKIDAGQELTIDEDQLAQQELEWYDKKKI